MRLNGVLTLASTLASASLRISRLLNIGPAHSLSVWQSHQAGPPPNGRVAERFPGGERRATRGHRHPVAPFRTGAIGRANHREYISPRSCDQKRLRISKSAAARE